MAHPDHPVLEWRGKLVDDLTREELVELVGVLHTMVWASAENFERILAKSFPHHDVRGNA